MPLKDFAKRKRNEQNATQIQQANDGQPSKKIKFDINVNGTPSNDLQSNQPDSNVEDTEAQVDRLGQSSEAGSSKTIDRKKNKKIQYKKTTQSSNKPVQFDYSQVDFQKFKGGSQKNKANGNEVQTKFHGKVNRIFSYIFFNKN